MKNLLSRFHKWLKEWKPIHLCWWFEKHNLPIPPYFIGRASASPSQSPSRSPSASPSPASYVDKYATVGNTYTDKYTSLGSRNVD